MAKTVKGKGRNSTFITPPPPPPPSLASQETLETISIVSNVLDSNIIKPPEPVKPNETKTSLTFTSSAVQDCLIFSRATFNVDLKIELMLEYTPVIGSKFVDFANGVDSTLIENNGFLTNFFYDELEKSFNESIVVSQNIIVQAYKDAFLKRKAINLDFQILGYTNDLSTLVGKVGLTRDATEQYVYGNANLSLSGKDTAETNSQGLVANEQFKLFFFNSEKVQEIAPVFSVGNNVFNDLALPVISSLTLGKNLDKV